MDTLQNAAVYLSDVLINLYITVLLLRFLLQASLANPYNPLTQLSIRLTKPLVKPLQHLLPKVKRFDLALLFLLLSFELIKNILSGVIVTQEIPPLEVMLINGVAELINKTIYIYIFAIIAQSLMSWFRSPQFTVLNEVLFYLTNPLMTPIRRFVPLVGGMDISPIPAIICLQLLSILITRPLMLYAISISGMN